MVTFFNTDQPTHVQTALHIDLTQYMHSHTLAHIFYIQHFLFRTSLVFVGQHKVSFSHLYTSLWYFSRHVGGLWCLKNFLNVEKLSMVSSFMSCCRFWELKRVTHSPSWMRWELNCSEGFILVRLSATLGRVPWVISYTCSAGTEVNQKQGAIQNEIQYPVNILYPSTFCESQILVQKLRPDCEATYLLMYKWSFGYYFFSIFDEITTCLQKQ